MTHSKREAIGREIARRSKGLVSGEDLKSLQQPNSYTCVHTCLAMVTGLPINAIIKVYGDHRGLTSWDKKDFMGLCGIRYYDEVGVPNFKRYALWMFSIDSLNKGGGHCLLAYTTVDREVRVIDPNMGILDKWIYTKEDLLGGANRPRDFLRLEAASFYVPGGGLDDEA